jgi:hypothetical protein
MAKNSEESKNNYEEKVSCNDSMDFGRYIKNFKHQGFELESCAHELVGNSIDSESETVKVISQKKEGESKIRYVDNGKGMSREDVREKYCKFHGENHKTDSSIGTQGVGGKKSAYLLSMKTGVAKVITTNNGSNYTTLTMNFKKAIDTKDLGNLYTIRNSNSDEIEQFVEDRGGNRNMYGFTLIMPFDLDIYQMWHKLITKPKDIDVTDHRLDIAFGEFDIEFSFVNKENKTHNGSLTEGYNYFDEEEGPLDFEIVDDDESGIVRCPVEVYQNKRDKNVYAYPFEYIGKQWSVPTKAGRGKGITPRIDTNNYEKDTTWEKVTREGQMVLEVAFRKNDNFFKHDSLLGPNSAAQCQSNYDKKFFKKPDNDFLSAVKINRNNHAMAPIGQPKVLNNSRANLGGRATMLTQITLRVTTTGSQDDKFIDELIKMSQNKGAMREHNCLPHKLICSINWLRQQHRDKVLYKMEKVVLNNIKIKTDKERKQAEVIAHTLQPDKEECESDNDNNNDVDDDDDNNDDDNGGSSSQTVDASSTNEDISKSGHDDESGLTLAVTEKSVPSTNEYDSKSDCDEDDWKISLENHITINTQLLTTLQNQKEVYPQEAIYIEGLMNIIREEMTREKEEFLDKHLSCSTDAEHGQSMDSVEEFE